MNNPYAVTVDLSQSAMHVPADIMAQCGYYEKAIIAQRDAKVTNFANPFPCATDHERTNDGWWTYSDTLGKAFKVDSKSRNIIEYAERPVRRD